MRKPKDIAPTYNTIQINEYFSFIKAYVPGTFDWNNMHLPEPLVPNMIRFVPWLVETRRYRSCVVPNMWAGVAFELACLVFKFSKLDLHFKHVCTHLFLLTPASWCRQLLR